MSVKEKYLAPGATCQNEKWVLSSRMNWKHLLNKRNYKLTSFMPVMKASKSISLQRCRAVTTAYRTLFWASNTVPGVPTEVQIGCSLWLNLLSRIATFFVAFFLFIQCHPFKFTYCFQPRCKPFARETCRCCSVLLLSIQRLHSIAHGSCKAT